MSLKLNFLELQNYRNFQTLNITNFEDLVVFEGPNAVGKTNLLEAVQLITSNKSFRNSKNEYLVRNFSKRLVGETLRDSKNPNALNTASIKGKLRDGSRNLDISLSIRGNEKEFKVNGNKKNLQTSRKLCPSVTFIPDDLKIVKRSNSYRRDSLDKLGCLVSENYRVIRRDFITTLQNKNKLLKEENLKFNAGLLEAQNEVFTVCSSQLTIYRYSLLNRLNEYLVNIYREISQSKETLTCEYVPNWCKYEIGKKKDFSKEEARGWLQILLEREKQKEINTNISTVGAQKDEITFYIDDKNASIFASQGQQRSIVLAYKIAEVLLIQDILNVKPILLLDDVMSELDDVRRACLLSFIQDDMQVFITTTHLDYFESDFLDKAQIINVQKLCEW